MGMPERWTWWAITWNAVMGVVQTAALVSVLKTPDAAFGRGRLAKILLAIGVFGGGVIINGLWIPVVAFAELRMRKSPERLG